MDYPELAALAIFARRRRYPSPIMTKKLVVPEEQKLFQEASRYRCCAVMAAESSTASPELCGTGTALRRDDGTLFILTCQHSVEEFLRGKVGWVNFFNPTQQVDRRDWSVVHADPRLDVAVLRLSPPRARRVQDLRPLVLEDIGTRTNYRNAKPGSRCLYVATGFPQEFAKGDDKTKKIDLPPLILATAPLSNAGNRVVFDYHHGKVGDRRLSPKGMSGCLFFEMHAIESEADAPRRASGGIWTPGVAVAMQHSWNKRDRLNCSPVHQLRKIIELA